MGTANIESLPVTVNNSHQDIPRGRQDYVHTLETLSNGSVNQHFDAFKDIDWDNPDFSIIPHDKRWILGPEDNLGAHPWYQSLSQERQIEVGLHRSALVAKVGLQFEQILISGIMFSNLMRRNNDPAFRYTTHEATEETHHTQMFQEFVNRSGVDVHGMPKQLRLALGLGAAAAAVVAPEILWTGVLAGEEPIDHAQKEMLRKHGELHPLFERIMQIHVAEEARHIGFAHLYLGEKVPELNPARKAILSAAYPVIMRVLGDTIMRPSGRELEQMGIPKEVVKEIWWEAPESKTLLKELFSDARMLADNVGIRGRLGRTAWKLMGIDGRPSRWRNEPARQAA